MFVADGQPIRATRSLDKRVKFHRLLTRRFEGCRSAVVKALAEFETHLGTDFVLRFCLDAFREWDGAEIQCDSHECGKQILTGLGCRIDVADQLHVELEDVRRDFAQFHQSTLAGAEIVIGKLHVQRRKQAFELLHLLHRGHGGFVNFDRDVGGRMS